MKHSKIAFLDRDGVINVDYGYVGKREDFVFLPNAVSGLKQLSSLGYKIVIVTNQAGIARGYYTENDFHKLTSWMLSELQGWGVEIEDVRYCPHHPEGIVDQYRVVCSCRKPESGMITGYLKNADFAVNEMILIGDKFSDLYSGKDAGIDKLFLISDNSVADNCDEQLVFTVCSDLLNVVQHL
jgi:D-glycero-D-manno-heptose 1,7-bisphosphate phosphatase